MFDLHLPFKFPKQEKVADVVGVMAEYSKKDFAKFHVILFMYLARRGVIMSKNHTHVPRIYSCQGPRYLLRWTEAHMWTQKPERGEIRTETTGPGPAAFRNQAAKCLAMVGEFTIGNSIGPHEIFCQKFCIFFSKFCFCTSIYCNSVSFDCALDRMWSLHLSTHVQSVWSVEVVRNCSALYFGLSKEFHHFLQTLPASRAGASMCLHCFGGLKYLKWGCVGGTIGYILIL